MLAIDLPNVLAELFRLVGAGAAAFLLYRIGGWFSSGVGTTGARRRMERFSVREGKKSVQEDAFGSEKHRLRLAFARYRMNVDGHEIFALWLARILLGAAVALLLNLVGLEPLFCLIGFAGGVLLVNGMKETAWQAVKAELEREVPIFLNSFISSIQVTGNLVRAVDGEIATLDPKGPLAAWLRHFVQVCQSRGLEALPELEKEAFTLSVSLGSMVFLMRRLQETGGEEYRHAFELAVENQSGILDGRAQARATGSGARGAVGIIVAMVIFVVVMMVRNPTVARAVHTPLVQVVYAGLALLMCFGWGLMNKMIDEMI